MYYNPSLDNSNMVLISKQKHKFTFFPKDNSLLSLVEIRIVVLDMKILTFLQI